MLAQLWDLFEAALQEVYFEGTKTHRARSAQALKRAAVHSWEGKIRDIHTPFPLFDQIWRCLLQCHIMDIGVGTGRWGPNAALGTFSLYKEGDEPPTPPRGTLRMVLVLLSSLIGVDPVANFVRHFYNVEQICLFLKLFYFVCFCTADFRLTHGEL